jgi:hypothetical protein
MSEQPDPYQCAGCGTEYPVPSLARDCEQRHEQGHPVRASDVPMFVKKRIG